MTQIEYPEGAIKTKAEVQAVERAFHEGKMYWRVRRDFQQPNGDCLLFPSINNTTLNYSIYSLDGGTGRDKKAFIFTNYFLALGYLQRVNDKKAA